MILTDFSQLYISAALVHPKEFEKGQDVNQMYAICRHTSLNTLLSDKQKFCKDFGEIILAADSDTYWRRNIFPYYKGLRKQNKEESSTDWDSVNQIGTDLIQELKENFPYKIIHVDEAEADDIIAVMCKWTQTNEVGRSGVFDDVAQPVLIKSSDGDFGQLHKYDNVRQWHPMSKKFVPKSGKHDLLEKCLVGDRGDGIPSIRSTPDQLMKGIRQLPITAALKEQAVAMAEAGKPIKFNNDEWNTAYERNRTLIDFDFIPKEVEDKIIAAYLNTKPVMSKSKIFNYCVKNRLRQITGRIHEF